MNPKVHSRSAMADFCEQSVGLALLQLVSRAQAIAAELLRLSDHLPPALRGSGTSAYAAVLFDFSYFKTPEVFEQQIESNTDVAALDDEFREFCAPLLERFFLLFNGIVTYYKDLLRFLQDLQQGVYIQSTVESVLHNEDGCQLLVEALVLHGVVLMLLEHRLDGKLREHLLIGHFRCTGSFDVPQFNLICTLCISVPVPPAPTIMSLASLFQGSPVPAPATMLQLHRPEDIISRFPLPSALVLVVIERLRSHDLYSQIRHYPSPEHRNAALLCQGGCLYVLLYSAPKILQSDAVVMREIVQKFFKFYWIVPIFMGFTADLTSAWDRFKAAKGALASCVTPSAVRGICTQHVSQAEKSLAELAVLLSNGVLTSDFVMSNLHELLACLRCCNVSLRWLLLHRNTTNRKLRELVVNQGSSEALLLTLLLDTSRLEVEIKRVYSELLAGKKNSWMKHRNLAAECMQDLSGSFSGEKSPAKTTKDENLQLWFSQMALQINVLDYAESVLAGRKIQHMISALEEVEQFHQIESRLHTKHCLSEARSQLQEMVRTLNVQESVLATMSVISDASYAWGLIGNFTSGIHERIQNDPLTVSKLQCLFLKLRSALDTPLLRISQCQSADFESVSEYYSSELAAYVRKVLEIVPVSVYSILTGTIKVQTKTLTDLPVRLEKDCLRDYAKLNERYTLAKATEKIALFTEGIMSMKKTFIGVIELDPRQLLEDGLRRQLGIEIASVLETTLVFSTGRNEEFENRLKVLSDSFRSQQQSMEYLQDYVHIHGLQLWQEEYAKIIHRNTSEECRSFFGNSTRSNERDTLKASNFTGRVMLKLLNLTNPARSMYLSPMSGWFNAEGLELVGIRTFKLLHESLGPVAVTSLDTLLSHAIASNLQKCISGFCLQIDIKFAEELQTLETAISPPAYIPKAGVNAYNECVTKLEGTSCCASLLEVLAHIGQLQLIRCLLLSQLRAACQVDSSLISFALEGFHAAVWSNLSAGNETTDMSEFHKRFASCGLCSPLKSIYLAQNPPQYLALQLFLATITQLPRYVVDTHLGTLTSRMKKSALDCCPLIVGIATLLQQFHRSHRSLYMQYMGQFALAHFESSCVSETSKTSSKTLWEVFNTTTWLLEFVKYTDLHSNDVEKLFPAHMLRSFTR